MVSSVFAGRIQTVFTLLLAMKGWSAAQIVRSSLIIHGPLPSAVFSMVEVFDRTSLDVTLHSNGGFGGAITAAMRGAITGARGVVVGTTAGATSLGSGSNVATAGVVFKAGV